MKSVRKPGFSIRHLLKQANRFRNLSLLLLALLIATALILFVVNVSGQGGGSALLISEFRVRGPNGANDEYIEVITIPARPMWLLRPTVPSAIQ